MSKILTARQIAEAEPFEPHPGMKRFIEAWVHAGVPLDEARRIAEWGVMPIGGAGVDAGETVVQNVPIGLPVVYDTDAFFRLTQRNFYRHETRDWAADSWLAPIELPKVGVISKVHLGFRVQLQQTVAAGTSRASWPYGILQDVEFTANGQDKLVKTQSIALKALERARYTGNYDIDQGDRIGADLGHGGGITVGIANHELHLHWEIPFATDEASLFGALFAQARQLALSLQLRTAPIARIIGSGTTAFAAGGQFHIGIETFSLPVVSGKMVLPKHINWLHGLNETVQPFTATGDVRVAITRQSGKLQRILLQLVQDRNDAQDFYDPALDGEVDEFRLEYGANDQAYTYRPGQFLLNRNARDYGDRMPYRYVAWDFARYNPIRDGLDLAALTNFFVIPTIDSGAAPVNGDARVLIETLYS